MTKPTLRFREDGTFTIAQLTDLHMHDGLPNCQKTLALMGELLDEEQPDFVVLTGDMVSPVTSDAARALTWVVEVLEERRVPWAAVFGNHDDEADRSKEELMALQQSFAHCLSEPGPDHLPGLGNYVVTVRGAASDEPAAVFYMFDSHQDAPKSVGGWAWIEPDQVAWYVATARAMGQHLPERLPALAFFHIPVPEYDLAWREGGAAGHKYESVGGPRLNSGLFTAFLTVGDVLGTFVGHDHVNDYDAELYGVRLCYGRAGGFGTYGRDGFARGARFIRLREGKPTFETWLRLEDGAVIHRGEGPTRD